MMQTFLSKFFKKTPEQELAAKLREAADSYNRALHACKQAGLSVWTKCGPDYGHRIDMFDHGIRNIDVYRHNHVSY